MTNKGGYLSIDRTTFDDQFSVFRERVLRKGKSPFVSFREGFVADWEGYKEPLRQKALVRLGASTWSANAIGSGQILKKLISAIEITKEGDEEANNLVNWPNEYGHRNRSHYVLLDAIDEAATRRKIEQWAFDFYRGDPDYGASFDELRNIAGSRYDLLAYLFFLHNSNEFMPIGSQTFDKAFQALGIQLKTAWRCSWENYRQYIVALQDIRTALEEYAGLSDVKLVDAHSFCWLLVRPELERPDVLIVNSAKGKASNAKIYGGREIAIENMINTIVSTVKHSNGQKVEVTKKLKELWMSETDLAAHLEYLIEKQGERCALTGIKFDFRKENFDRKLRTSPDRIDSNGHYTAGNLQVVCSFINGWKGATPDLEFRRLLDLVRRPSEAD